TEPVVQQSLGWSWPERVTVTKVTMLAAGFVFPASLFINVTRRMSDNPTKATRPVHKRWWFWAIALVIFFWVVGSMGGNSPSAPSSDVSNPAAVQQEPPL